MLRIQPNRDELERLILCGCFDDLHSNRRTLLWAIPSAMTWLASMSGNSLHLTFDEPKLDELIEDFSIQEKAMYEREILDLDEVLAAHAKVFLGSKASRIASPMKIRSVSRIATVKKPTMP